MKKFDELVALIKDKSDNEKIKVLNDAIDAELSVSGDADTLYIDRCIDMIGVIKGIPFVPTEPDGIKQKTARVFDLYGEKRRQNRNKMIAGGFKTLVKVLAAAIALVFLMGCALYIVNKDAFYALLREMGYESFDEMPRGNVDINGKTVKKNLGEYNGKTAAEIKEKTGEDIFYPSRLPEGYTVENIYYIVFENETKLGFEFSPKGKIDMSATDLYKAPAEIVETMEQYVSHGMTFYLSELELENGDGEKYTEYRALFDDGELQYTVTALSKDDLYTVIDGVVKG